MTTMIDRQVRADFLQALSVADEEAAIGIAVDLTEGGVPVPAVLAELIAPAQRAVGEHWAADRWSVAREHAATHICDRVVAALALRIPSGRPAPGRVVLACVDGEWHALPARIVAEVLRAEGWAVTFLGASTPAEHLARFIHETGPDAVALSCSISTSLPKARSMIEAARDTGVPVLAGGGGFGPDGRWALLLGADAWAPDAAGAAARLAQDWPAFTRPAPGLVHLPDDEHTRLATSRTAVVDQAMAAFTGGDHTSASHSARRFEATREDFGYIIDFLAAALLVDDETLFTSFTGWLVEVLRVRGVPPRATAGGYDALATALTGLPRAVRLLAAGRALLPGYRSGSPVAPSAERPGSVP